MTPERDGGAEPARDLSGRHVVRQQRRHAAAGRGFDVERAQLDESIERGLTGVADVYAVGHVVSILSIRRMRVAHASQNPSSPRYTSIAQSCAQYTEDRPRNANEEIGFNEAETCTGRQACPSRLDGCDATHEIDPSVAGIISRTG